jgi:two-component system nitrate/nitrite response regulator NarL
MDVLRVLVVADDPLVRGGLAALLDAQSECTVVGQLSTGVDLAAEVDTYRPDAILWDLGWDPAPDSSLWDAGDPVGFRLPLVALLAEESLAAEVWATGARGLLLRDAEAETLLAALQAVAQGLAVLDPALVASVLPTVEEPSSLLVEQLTAREMEVLQLLAEGLSNKAIAHKLEISEHTVKFHVNAILGKLGAQSRTEAVVRATRLGLILL